MQPFPQDGANHADHALGCICKQGAGQSLRGAGAKRVRNGQTSAHQASIEYGGNAIQIRSKSHICPIAIANLRRRVASLETEIGAAKSTYLSGAVIVNKKNPLLRSLAHQHDIVRANVQMKVAAFVKGFQCVQQKEHTTGCGAKVRSVPVQF